MIELIEHINFKVPYLNGKEQIQSFYVETLGAPECESGRLKVAISSNKIKEGTVKQMHVNLGQSQIHFEWCVIISLKIQKH